MTSWIKAAVLAVCICVTGYATASAEEAAPVPKRLTDVCASGAIEWEITQLDARGMVEVHAVSTNYREGSIIRSTDVPHLQQYFEAHSVSQLTGKRFSVACSLNEHNGLVTKDPLEALDKLAMEAAHHGHYVPPTDEQLHARMVSALAKMQQPEFLDVDEETVYEAFSRLYYGSATTGGLWDERRADPKWIASLTHDIAVQSGGSVRLTHARKEDFSFVSRCGCEDYFLLENDSGPSQRILIGPYKSPVVFDHQAKVPLH